jgi:hypothetical protein
LFEILKNTRVLILNKENEKLKESCEKNNIIFNRLTKDDIFSDNGLKELCRKLPTKESELNINIIFGVSEKNLNKYGKNFLANIIQFIIENNIKEKKIDDEDKNRIEIQNLSLKLEKKEDFKNNEDFNFSDLELFQFNEEEFNNNSVFYYVINKLSYSLNKFDISIFKKNENKISSINLKFNTNYEVSIIGNTKINICISDLKLIDIQGKNINISYIKDFIVSYLKENKICLTDKGISLRDIYTYMTSIQSDNNGVFISGQQLYQ